MFERERIRHTLEVRHLTVQSSTMHGELIKTITFTSPDLHDFVSLGTTDHVKMFFPDPATGELTAPTKTEDGSIQRPDSAVSFNRDYTPAHFAPATEGADATVDFDFYLHDNSGLATEWARKAAPGDQVAIVGPRGSVMPPKDAKHFLLIADETGFTAFSRWLRLIPEDAKVTGIVLVEDEGLEDFFSPKEGQKVNIEWLYRFDGPGQLIEAVRSAADLITDETFVWAAGEAGELVPVRRFFKYDLELDRSQYHIQGYWKQGIVNRDHHEPIDPTDPES